MTSGAGPNSSSTGGYSISRSRSSAKLNTTADRPARALSSRQQDFLLSGPSSSDMKWEDPDLTHHHASSHSSSSVKRQSWGPILHDITANSQTRCETAVTKSLYTPHRPINGELADGLDDTHSSNGHDRGPRSSSTAAALPVELLLAVFSFYDPPPTAIEANALLTTSSTTSPLLSCALVCRRWCVPALQTLWCRPRVYDVGRFEKIVKTIELSALYINNDPASRVLNAPAAPKGQRHISKLSTLLPRILLTTSFHSSLALLDLGFCKGISNYSLLKSAHSLTNLQSLNLAGGGRSEIVIIKIANECPLLRRFGLAWNEGVTDFVLKEIGRKLLHLEWLDLSGCWKLSDAGILGFARCQNGNDDIVAYLDRLLNCTSAHSSKNSRDVYSERMPSIDEFESGSTSSSYLPLSPPMTRPPSPPLSFTSSSSHRSPSRTSTLRHLSLSYCSNVTGLGVLELVNTLTDMRHLNVVGCADVGPALMKIRQAGDFPRLFINSPRFPNFWS
ncbi:hypothetical protein SeLEV6574_g00322 [Synchytrium endobioticum]|uniref:F-box domain-containing protein n=1 Tax=Synchytrium endobioticum TaxID=286115 RepID=A0A507DIH5_9FUNG|nr:hypothetical protein SeLEV6574_g00322 [Synchytrium endobioticum]